MANSKDAIFSEEVLDCMRAGLHEYLGRSIVVGPVPTFMKAQLMAMEFNICQAPV